VWEHIDEVVLTSDRRAVSIAVDSFIDLAWTLDDAAWATAVP